MADTKVSAAAAITAVLATTEFPVNDAGTSKKATAQQLAAYIGDSIGNQSTADQTINASTTALLTGSTLAIPVGKLRIGTILKWRITVSKTAAGTAAVIYLIKLGTAGTTSDATVITFTMPVGTGVVDVGQVDITITVRGPLSASGILQGHFHLAHNLSTTGLANVPNVNLNVTSGSVDVTVANLIASVTCTTPASTVLTFQQVTGEAKNL